MVTPQTFVDKTLLGCNLRCVSRGTTEEDVLLTVTRLVEHGSSARYVHYGQIG